MDKTALVGFDVEKGSRILQILEDAGLQVKVALWAFLAEYDEWRLVLSSRSFDALDLREAYDRLHQALDAAGLSLQETPTVVILRMNDPFVKALRKIFAKTKSVEGMRLGGQIFGDRFVEDAYAYRIS
ncbi:MAG TPA: hypothetical protein VK724_11895 [Bryobacteraceae bacterium]|jgi:hypothetical protein|nr:hypothetical protein [Bryobacteraceae bacterium]